MISLKDIERLAALSRLGLEKSELKNFQKDLEGILGYMEELQKAGVTDAKPISHITGLENKTREDKSREKLSSPDLLLGLAPRRKGRWVKVVRIVKREV